MEKRVQVPPPVALMNNEASLHAYKATFQTFETQRVLPGNEKQAARFWVSGRPDFLLDNPVMACIVKAP